MKYLVPLGCILAISTVHIQHIAYFSLAYRLKVNLNKVTLIFFFFLLGLPDREVRGSAKECVQEANSYETHSCVFLVESFASFLHKQ